jgi:hypothetical protein
MQVLDEFDDARGVGATAFEDAEVCQRRHRIGPARTEPVGVAPVRRIVALPDATQS